MQDNEDFTYGLLLRVLYFNLLNLSLLSILRFVFFSCVKKGSNFIILKVFYYFMSSQHCSFPHWIFLTFCWWPVDYKCKALYLKSQFYIHMPICLYKSTYIYIYTHLYIYIYTSIYLYIYIICLIYIQSIYLTHKLSITSSSLVNFKHIYISLTTVNLQKGQ